MKFCIGVPYKQVSDKHEFHENRLSDSRTLLMGVNEFVPSLSIFLNRFGLNLEFTIFT
jgi:hypothetical protein